MKKLFLLFLFIFAFAVPVNAFNPLMVCTGAVASGGFSQTVNIATADDDGMIHTCDSSSSGTLDSDGIANAGYIGSYLSNGSAFYAYSYFRFALSAEIANGATITSAEIRITGGHLGSLSWEFNDDTARYTAEASDNASQVASADRCPAYGSSTTNLNNVNVDDVPSAWENDTEYAITITTIIQDLVDDYSGLSSGNYVQIWASSDDPHTYTETINAELYEEGTSAEAELYIAWTE